jgi:hypothetical protein
VIEVRLEKLTRYGYGSALIVKIPRNFLLELDRAIKVAKHCVILVGKFFIGA